jgi:uncharacterized protein YjbI with pentapeptide repeats
MTGEPRRKERRGPRLLPVGPVLAAVFAVAVLVAGAVFYAGWGLLRVRGLRSAGEIDARTLFDLVKVSFGVVAGAGALVGLVVAYRRQRVVEDGALRDRTRLHTERFTAAVSQLGDDSPAVRLGGVHALAGLADDAPTHALSQTAIDVLCAVLRLPSTAKAREEHADGDPAALRAHLALREVRHTVIRVVRDHLRLPPGHPRTWQGYDFDFTNAVLDGGDFTGAVFSGGTVSFRGAVFSEGTADFRSAAFSGATVDFGRAEFSGGGVHFHEATFSGGRVDFGDAQFSSGTVDFAGAEFTGGTAAWDRAVFSGTTVDFTGALWSGAALSWTRAEFSGGTVKFGMRLHGGADFHDVVFSGARVDFGGAHFSGGTTDFGRARFSEGVVSFAGTHFSGGTADFSRTRFSGARVDFGGARFSGATVLFGGATGPPPTGLLPVRPSALPPLLLLPPEWTAAR